MTDNENILTPSKIIKFLDYAYEKSIDGIGIPGIDTAHSLAESYLKTGSSLKEQINSLIRWQNTKSATSGFLTAKWHLNRSQFGIRIDHDLASISDHSLASQSITIWHASDH